MLSLMSHLQNIEFIATRVLQVGVGGDNTTRVNLNTDSEGVTTDEDAGDLTTEDEDDEGDELNEKFSLWFTGAQLHDTTQLRKWNKYFNDNPRIKGKRLKDFDIQHIISRVAVDYRPVYTEQHVLVDEWCKKTENTTQNEQSMLNFKTFKTSNTLKGIDFLKEKIDSETDTSAIANPHGTMIQGDGGFVIKYSHTIPALFLRDAFRRSNNSNMEFHVLCHGFKFEEGMFEWDWSYANTPSGEKGGQESDNSEYFATLLLNSDDLRSIRAGPVEKNLRRICIWLQVHEHVMLLCWDEFRVPTFFRHYFTIYCNMGGETTNTGSIKKGLEKVFRKNGILDEEEEMRFDVRYSYEGIFRTKIDFACVSAMARSGLVLSWFESLNFNVMLDGQLKDKRTTTKAFYLMRDNYALFEEHLFEFVSEKSKGGHMILFPPSLNAHFINVLNVSLIAMDVEGRCTEYVYFGDKHKFQTKNFVPPKQEARCVIS